MATRDVAIRAEAVAPQGLAQNRDVLLPGKECTANDRLDTQERKQVRSHTEAEDAHGKLIARKIHAVGVDGGHLGEGVAAVAIVDEVEWRSVRVIQLEFRHRLGYGDELIGVRVGKRVQQQGIGGGEHRSAGRNSGREDQDGCQSEGRIVAQLAHMGIVARVCDVHSTLQQQYTNC